MNADNILFRCSALGQLMTEPRSKSETISETAKQYLQSVYIEHVYERREELKSKYLDKGNENEEQSITLLSRFTKKLFKKNQIRLSNSFITGEPDMFIGEEIERAEEIYDAKTSYNIFTFFDAKNSALNKNYFWQMQGYMILTGATKSYVCYCLTNSTPKIIDDEKRSLQWRMGLIDPSGNVDYLRKAAQIEVNHIYDLISFQRDYPYYQLDWMSINEEKDFPIIDFKERVVIKQIDRDEEAVKKIESKVVQSREWMNENLFNQ